MRDPMTRPVPLENVNVLARVRAFLLRLAETPKDDEADGMLGGQVELMDSWIAEAREFMEETGMEWSDPSADAAAGAKGGAS